MVRSLGLISTFLFFFLVAEAVNTVGNVEEDSRMQEFWCTKSVSTNLRNGPGPQFPIVLRILRHNYPLLAVQKVDNWFAVKDVEGDIYWVFTSNLSKKCGGMVNSSSFVPLYFKPTQASVILYKLTNGFIIDNLECTSKIWCRGIINRKAGWIERKYIWGK